MNRFLFLLMLVLCGYTMHAQPRCGFDGRHHWMLTLDSFYNNKVQQINTRWTNMMSSSSMGLLTTTPAGTVYEIPVVIHVIHTGGAVGTIYNPTDAQLTGMINYLNQAYNATYASYPAVGSGGVYFPVKFVLAKRDPSCSATTGINRVDGSSVSGYSANGVNAGTIGASEVAVKALSKWPNNEYYNIWVVNKIDGMDGTSGIFTAGYAYFPGASPTIDGTVMLATQAAAGSITLPHEIGHAFNLYHTFEGDGTGSTCPTNTNCTTDGDMVCDTEPHKRSPFNCPSGTNPCTGLSYNNVTNNFMDYSNCQNRFTAGQKVRWLDGLLTYRPGLVSSMGGVAPSTNVIAANCTTTVTNTSNNFEMGPKSVVLNDLTSNSGGYTTEGYVAYVDRSCQLRANLIQGQSYTLSVGTTTNTQKVAVFIDYNNDGIFGSGEQVYAHTGTTSPETHSTTYTVPSSGVTTCTPLRMRVIADFVTSTIPSNGCGALAYGQAEDFTVFVKPATATVTLTNAITTGSNPSCTGSSLTFTATPSSSPTSPTYNWYVNGTQVGTGTTYTTSSIVDNSTVQCKLNYTNGCSLADSSFSNTITVTRTSALTPAVSIAANPGSAICSGTSVTFTATPTNGGTTPSYQWKLNGVNTGTNSSTYTNGALANGDVVSCVMTSNASCASPATATSNSITMVVSTSVTPSVSIAANPGSSICAGTSVTFTATPTNGGATPSYQWKLNGGNVGTNSTTYTNAALANGDVVTCVMTSNASCASPATATSNNITMAVTATVTPSVSISANPGSTICTGTSVTFTATPTNGGSTPSYQWKLNGGNVGTNSTTYTNASLTNGDIVTCVMTSNATCASPATATSTGITMTVTTSVTPSVSVSANPGSTICSGTSVTFTATPTNGGGTPSYQWKLNGGNVGTNSTTYTNAALVNGDVITCVMTSNASCASPVTATSSAITMTVSSNVTPSVSISANPGSTICNGTSVTFTATPTNGGSTPSYQWKLNGVNVGTNSSTYTNASLANGNIITCVMTSNASCASPATATSTGITMTVNTTVVPAVSISANPGSTICSGTSVTFTATPTNGGTIPSYQWKLNGVNVGTNSTTYTNAALANGNIVTCVMTSNATCASPATATSTGITMTVNPTVAPSVSISANPGSSICAGTSVTFTATPTNGGTTPSYQWKLNGVNVGTNSTTYTNAALANGDIVACVLTSNATCASPATATSTGIIMSVTPLVTPAVSISANPGSTICNGTSVTFTATPTNGGASPSYQWKLNGFNVGANSATYTNTALANGDIVTCVLTSNASCVTTTTATSSGITMTVNALVAPSVSISANPGSTICSGTSVTFTATPTNGGSTPSYQWKLNGVNVGTNSATYTNAALANGNIITCVLTSNATCASPATATSSGITMTVTPLVVPSVAITANPGNTICNGTSVTFTATPTNGGTTPAYQWKLNGGNVGTNSNTYANTTLANGDVVICVLTSNVACASTSTATSSGITMTVNPLTIPAVSISSNTGAATCVNGTVTFTAVPLNGGTSQSYQWKMNSTNVGTNSTVYATNALANGDVITCVLTITATCPSPGTVTSNSMTMNVTTPSIAISVTPNDTICAGTPATFSITPANVGTSPQYQWKRNGVDMVGATASVYTIPALTSGDVITSSFTGSANCISAPATTGNNITMTVRPVLVPNVTIKATPGTTINAGQSVTFDIVSTNVAIPSYQWQKNGIDIQGANAASYTTSTLVNGDNIALLIGTADSCSATATALSNTLTMNIGTYIAPHGKAIDDMKLVPNPNNGTFNVQGTASTANEEAFIEIVNAVGVLVYKEQVKVVNHQFIRYFDLGDKMNNGLHMVRVTIGGETQIIKFITTR